MVAFIKEEPLYKKILRCLLCLYIYYSKFFEKKQGLVLIQIIFPLVIPGDRILINTIARSDIVFINYMREGRESRVDMNN